MRNNTIQILCYAYNATLFVENENDLLHKFATIASTFNISIFIGKTQTIVIFKESIRCKLAANNRIIHQIMKYNYLAL